MSERGADKLVEKRLEFSDVKMGDMIHITTGVGDQALHFDFLVEQPKDKDGWPTGVLSARMPDGTELPAAEFSLHGCGQWTTRAQNPVQTQERAFTPYYDGLVVGSYFWGAQPTEQGDRIAFTEPGQEISAIDVTRASRH